MAASSALTGKNGGSDRKWIGFVALAFLLGAIAAGIFWQFSGKTADDQQKSPGDDLPAPEKRGPAWFRDATPGSGIEFTYRNGEEADHFSMLETLGGGIALLDYDGDGLLDIFVTGGGYFGSAEKKEILGLPCKLYRNLGNWIFQDVTEETGLNIHWWYTHGAAVADYDRDGWPDLLVTGYGKVALFHNEPNGKGGRRFSEVPEKFAPQDNSWSTSAGWADIDGDGYPDLYICHYDNWSLANNPICPGTAPTVKRDTCGPGSFKPLIHSLFRNDKGRRFHDIAVEQRFRALGNGLAVVLVDVNDDGMPDIFVANDMNPKFLFINRRGKLEEKALESGVAVNESGDPDGSMGADAGDYDGSGRPSLWLTNFEGQLHALYQARGNEFFQHRSRAIGIAAIGQQFVGFGTGFFDFDNDGWEDLIFTNGHVWRFPYGQNPNQRHGFAPQPES